MRKKRPWNVEREAQVFTSDARACEQNYIDDVYFRITLAEGKIDTTSETFGVKT